MSAILAEKPADALAVVEAAADLSGSTRLSDGAALAHAQAIQDVLRGGDRLSLLIAAKMVQTVYTEGAVAGVAASRQIIDAAFDRKAAEA